MLNFGPKDLLTIARNWETREPRFSTSSVADLDVILDTNINSTDYSIQSVCADIHMHM